MLLAERDEGKARRGGLDGLFDAQVDERKIVIRAAGKWAKENPHVHSAGSGLAKQKIDGHAIPQPL
jgi:hypothetical protein